MTSIDDMDEIHCNRTETQAPLGITGLSAIIAAQDAELAAAHAARKIASEWLDALGEGRESGQAIVLKILRTLDGDSSATKSPEQVARRNDGILSGNETRYAKKQRQAKPRVKCLRCNGYGHLTTSHTNPTRCHYCNGLGDIEA